MEADFLRLILFLVGIVVVLIVYFWERHKRVNAQVHAIRDAEQRVDEIRETIEDDKWVITDEYQGEVEPELETHGESEPDLSSKHDDVVTSDDELSHELDQLSDLVAAESTLSLDQTEQMPLFSNDEPEEPVLTSDAESKVIIINLASRRSGFNGEDVLSAAVDVGLEPGEMNIFHHHSDTQREKRVSLFSMASMVEPGTFPLDNMDEFVTPGLTLFLQISGAQGGLALYDEMLIAAEKLAEHLDGELQDETHCTLTHQAIEFQREAIIEFQRRQMLAKSNT